MFVTLPSYSSLRHSHISFSRPKDPSHRLTLSTHSVPLSHHISYSPILDTLPSPHVSPHIISPILDPHSISISRRKGPSHRLTQPFPLLFFLTPGGSFSHPAGGESGVPRGGELGPHHLPLRGGGGSSLGLC